MTDLSACDAQRLRRSRPRPIRSNSSAKFNERATMPRHSAQPARPTAAWVNFSCACFAASVLLVGGGIFAVPLGWTIRACFAAGMAMLVLSSFILAKTMRDLHETKRMIDRIGDVRVHKLLRAERP